MCDCSKEAVDIEVAISGLILEDNAPHAARLTISPRLITTNNGSKSEFKKSRDYSTGDSSNNRTIGEKSVNVVVVSA